MLTGETHSMSSGIQVWVYSLQGWWHAPTKTYDTWHLQVQLINWIRSVRFTLLAFNQWIHQVWEHYLSIIKGVNALNTWWSIEVDAIERDRSSRFSLLRKSPKPNQISYTHRLRNDSILISNKNGNPTNIYIQYSLSLSRWFVHVHVANPKPTIWRCRCSRPKVIK